MQFIFLKIDFKEMINFKIQEEISVNKRTNSVSDVIFKIGTPENFFKNFYNKININTKKIFLCSIIMATLTHIYFFMHKYANKDALSFVGRVTSRIHSGRWFGGYTVYYFIPIFTGIVSILSLAIVVMLIISIFNVKEVLWGVVIAGLIVTFPTLSHSFAYFHMGLTYTNALLGAVLAVWLTKKYKYGFLLGAISLMLSLANYQSYICVSMVLSLIVIIMYFMDNSFTIKQSLIEILKYFLMGVLGFAFYRIGLEIMLNKYNVKLGSYKGMDSMGVIELNKIPMLLKKTYSRFFEFFTDNTFFTAPKYVGIMYGIVIFIIFCILVFIIVDKKLNIYRVSLICSFILLSPICFNFIDFGAPETTSNTLNVYAVVFVYIFPIILMERFIDFNKYKSILLYITNWGLMISTTVIILYYFWLTNLYYLKVETAYKHTIAIDNRILSRIESMEEFDINMPFVVLSNPGDIVYGKSTYQEAVEMFPYIISDPGISGIFIDGFGASTYEDATLRVVNLIKNNFGVELKMANNEQIDSVLMSKEYKKMGVWPSPDSVAVINGVMVVNFVDLNK